MKALWQRLPDLPTPALSGRFSGISGNALIVAGGSYFPKSLFEGGTKVLSDRIDLLDKPTGRWIQVGRLDRPVVQGASVSDATGVVCLGGGDLSQGYTDVSRLRWTGSRLERDRLPSLLVPSVFPGAAYLENAVYVAGGSVSPTATEALQGLWRLDLTQKSLRWETLPPIPGPGRIGPIVTAQAGAVYVFGGASLRRGPDGKPARTYLRDGYCYRPGEGWRRLADLPGPLVAAPAIADGSRTIVVFGGDDGANADRTQELKDKHPGFRRDVLAYDTISDRWSVASGLFAPSDPLPIGLVTTNAIRWNDSIVIPGGEDRPGHRSTTVLATPIPVSEKKDAMTAATQANVTQTVLFKAGDDGYHTFRIPALLMTKQGTLLAFAEGRKNGGGDAGVIDMTLKRSTDGGKTWGPLQIVWTDNGNTCGNPCPVVDQDTGIIHLLLTHNLGEDHESQIDDGTSKGTRTVWVTQSRDDGKTWDAPRDITATTKEKDWRWYATGPGVGIQLTRGQYKGRLVIPCDHNAPDGMGSRSHVIYSDDHGKTWQMGGTVPQKGMNECQVAELTDGRVMLNMRGSNKARDKRGVALSSDGGTTWTGYYDDATLVEPVCQGSLINASLDGKPALLFSNPADPEKRRNLTVRASVDDGKTWPWSQVLHEGPAAYSCLAMLSPDQEYACLYECGDGKPYETITLARFRAAWLKQ